MFRTMLFSVKMKAIKKTMIATLMIVMVLATGVAPILALSDNASVKSFGRSKLQATNQRLQQAKKKLQITKPEEIDLIELDESIVAERIADAEEAEAIEDAENAVGGLWILNARGGTVTISPVTDAEQATGRLGLQLVAEKMKVTEFGVLYKVHWGRMFHDGERVDIEGFALLDTDGVFYMSLEGDDLEFKAIGKIAPARVGVRVAMKGYMTHDGVEYSHRMNGRAMPFGWFQRARSRVSEKPNPEVEPSRNSPVPNNAAPA